MRRQFKNAFPEAQQFHDPPAEFAAHAPEPRTGPASSVAGIRPLFSLPVSLPAESAPVQPASAPDHAALSLSAPPMTPGWQRPDASGMPFSWATQTGSGTPFAATPFAPRTSGASALHSLSAHPSSPIFVPGFPSAPVLPFTQEHRQEQLPGRSPAGERRGQISAGKNVRARDVTKQVRRRGKRRVVLVGVLLICCAGLLVLAGGGYLLTRPTPASSTPTPVAQATQIPDAITPTGQTPGALPTVKPRITNLPALKPVPATVSGIPFLIMVSLSQQKLTAYDHGKPVLTTLVTTGMPALFTPPGTYHIFQRVANIYLYSKWPPGSPYYYAPVHVNYVLKMTTSGIYIHDATWRSVFGPGSNVPHTDPVYGQETGSHGCVETPLMAMKWLYNWAPLQTTVIVVE